MSTVHDDVHDCVPDVVHDVVHDGVCDGVHDGVHDGIRGGDVQDGGHARETRSGRRRGRGNCASRGHDLRDDVCDV